MPKYISNVVFFEVFQEEKEAIYGFLPKNINVLFYENTIQEEKCDIPDGAIISIRTQSEVPLSWESKISAILTRSTGHDHLYSFMNNSSVKIPCGFLPIYCARSVAEHALLIWTSLIKKLPKQIENFKTFNRNGITGSELKNKNLLVIGVGNIGIEIIRIASSLEMKVDGIDIVHKFDNVNYVSHDGDLAKYDIIVCAMNLTESNHSYFDNNFFDRIKKGCLFINISRGELSPIHVLNKYLKNEILAGIGLDVFDNEKLLALSLRNKKLTDDMKLVMELEKLPNVILTPHNAFNTHEATLIKSKQTIDQIESLIEHGSFIWEIP